MESGIREIKIKLELMNERHLLGGFKPTDTAKDVKVKASEMIETSVEGDLSLGALVLVPARFLDDDDTLESCCYDDGLSQEVQVLDMRLYPCLDKNIDIMKEYANFIHYLGLCEQELKELGGNTGTKRPAQLPTQATQVQDQLCYSGPLKLIHKNAGISELPLSQLLSAVEADTTATVVLLAPNDIIFRKLCALPLPEHEYLIVRVTWDLMSHYFVRLMRCSDNDLPLVAVTDLDPDHLDLFTFLDTPFDNLCECYGWDVENPFYPDEISVLSLIDIVDIMWLGLRPPQCTNPLHTSNDRRAHDLATSADEGFYKVIRLLLVHPIVQGKAEWLSALDWLYQHGKRVFLHPCTSNRHICPTSLLEDEGFIVNKVSNKDWV